MTETSYQIAHFPPLGLYAPEHGNVGRLNFPPGPWVWQADWNSRSKTWRISLQGHPEAAREWSPYVTRAMPHWRTTLEIEEWMQSVVDYIGGRERFIHDDHPLWTAEMGRMPPASRRDGYRWI